MLTADNVAQRTRVAAVQQRIERKVGELARAVRSRREQGFETAREVVRGAYGKREMDAIRAIFAEMKGEEARLLKERVASTRRAYTTAMLTSLVGALVSIGLIGLV